MKLKNIFFILVFLFLTFSLTAQNDPGWLWAKRGGSAAAFDFGYTRWDTGMERIVDVAVDGNNNYYYLAEVGGYTFTLSDMEFETYNDIFGKRDIFVFSTDESGNYRWSKIIGGGHNDFASSLVVDNQDDIYVSGTISNLNGNTPVHFDTDTIMPEGTNNLGPNNKKAFLVKYNSQGDFIWLRQPEGDEIPLGKSASIVKTIIDTNNQLHNLIWFGHGTHLNGQLTVEAGTFKAVIVKYDYNGNLIDFISLNMHPEIISKYKYQMAYDANRDRYYIADTNRGTSGIMGIGDYGNDTNAFYLAAVNNQGEVLWYHQDHIREWYSVGDLKLDNGENIYFSGFFTTLYADNPNSFAGYEFDAPGGGSGIKNPFLIKLDPDGNLLWGTNPDLYSPFPGQSIVINGDNVYLGLGMLHNTWDDVEITGPSGQGLVPDIQIMRFDAQTGEAQEVIDGNATTPSQDAIMSMAMDSNGDLVVGGYFGSDLFYDTDLHIHNNAVDSDFFIAKYHTGEEMGVKNQNLQTVKIYPNPTTGVLNLQSKTNLESYQLYDLQGRIVKQGKLIDKQIDLSGVDNGLYFLRVRDQTGNVENLKVVKK